MSGNATDELEPPEPPVPLELLVVEDALELAAPPAPALLPDEAAALVDPTELLLEVPLDVPFAVPHPSAKQVTTTVARLIIETA